MSNFVKDNADLLEYAGTVGLGEDTGRRLTRKLDELADSVASSSGIGGDVKIAKDKLADAIRRTSASLGSEITRAPNSNSGGNWADETGGANPFGNPPLAIDSMVNAALEFDETCANLPS